MADLLDLEIARNGVENAANSIDMLLIAHEGITKHLEHTVSDIESETETTWGLLSVVRNLNTFWEYLSEERNHLEHLVDRMESTLEHIEKQQRISNVQQNNTSR